MPRQWRKKEVDAHLEAHKDLREHIIAVFKVVGRTRGWRWEGNLGDPRKTLMDASGKHVTVITSRDTDPHYWDFPLRYLYEDLWPPEAVEADIRRLEEEARLRTAEQVQREADQRKAEEIAQLQELLARHYPDVRLP